MLVVLERCGKVGVAGRIAMTYVVVSLDGGARQLRHRTRTIC